MNLLWWEFRHHTTIFWRVPVAAFFTVAFPLFFLLMFGLLNADGPIPELGGIRFIQFFTPGIAVFSVVTACYTNLVITTALQREDGILKREIATPIPRWVAIGGRVTAAVGVGLVSVILLVLVGVVLFSVDVPWDRLGVAALVLVVGAATWSALGLAIAAVIRNGQTAPAVANATILPLAFISGIFFPPSAAPDWLATLSAHLPLGPFVTAFGDQWNPALAEGVPLREVSILAAWGLVGAVVAVRRFTWEPGRPRQDRRSR